MTERVLVTRNERNWKFDRYRPNLGPNDGVLFGTMEKGLIVFIENNDRISVSETKDGEKRIVDTVIVSEMNGEPYSRLIDEEAKTFVTFMARGRVGRKRRLEFLFPQGISHEPYKKED